MGALLDVTLPVFLVIGFGYAAVWRGLFAEGGIDALMKFAQNFAIPCLLFLSIARLDLAQNFDAGLLLAYYSGSGAAFAIGWTGAKAVFGRSTEEAIAIGFAAMFSNSVLLGLPITERAFGAGALGPNYAIIAVHAPFCYIIGITAMEITRASGAGLVAGLGGALRGISRNALMIGIGLGLVAKILRIPVPEVVNGALGLMSGAGLPAALFALGGVLYRYRPEGDLTQVGFILALTLVLHPAITWGLSQWPVGLERGPFQSAVLTASMGPGVNAFIFASMYGVALRVVASTVLIGTAVSILTVSAWLAIIG